MNPQSQQVLYSLKNQKVGVFCDDSNLYHAYLKYKWRIDFAKFQKLLEQYCELQFINYYVCIPDKKDWTYQGTVRFLRRIKHIVNFKKKKLKYTLVGGRVVKKGDVDVEIVLDIVRTIGALDVIVVMSGDSDFLELNKFVVNEKQKRMLFFGYEENMVWELRNCGHLYLNRIKELIV